MSGGSQSRIQIGASRFKVVFSPHRGIFQIQFKPKGPAKFLNLFQLGCDGFHILIFKVLQCGKVRGMTVQVFKYNAERNFPAAADEAAAFFIGGLMQKMKPFFPVFRVECPGSKPRGRRHPKSDGPEPAGVDHVPELAGIKGLFRKLNFNILHIMGFGMMKTRIITRTTDCNRMVE